MSFKGNISARNAKSPYEIKVAPGFTVDRNPYMKMAYDRIKGEEEAVNTQHQKLIGNLDNISADFHQVFSSLTNIRTKLVEAKSSTLGLTKSHLKVLRILVKYLDKINGAIINKVIPLIDELGRGQDDEE